MQRIKVWPLFVMWHARIKVHAFVLPILFYSPMQTVPILRSVKEALRKDRFSIFMESFRQNESFFFVQRLKDSFVHGSLLTWNNIVISPQVMVCTGERKNNLLQKVHCPLIQCLPGPGSLMVERFKASGLQSHTAHS